MAITGRGEASRSIHRRESVALHDGVVAQLLDGLEDVGVVVGRGRRRLGDEALPLLVDRGEGTLDGLRPGGLVEVPTERGPMQVADQHVGDGVDGRVDVETRGGRLTIAWGDNAAHDAPVFMTGPATSVFEGEIVGEFPPSVSEEELGIAMLGGRREAVA